MLIDLVVRELEKRKMELLLANTTYYESLEQYRKNAYEYHFCVDLLDRIRDWQRADQA